MVTLQVPARTGPAPWPPRLLRDTDIDVQGIALMVGFNNADNFATAFRERVGVPPSAYRKASLDGNSD
ncbi:helix-turn-helix domain-containing protein [Massilia mucilaginosa]|uniref:helix-turn-helix domain-containing protein n=1 Tax=Massilia mucilaginosa TaxID=2609282 RepID=UPI0028051D8C|nr:helix-turn-helix domain-containing protein [Massilia mucilaginosa]